MASPESLMRQILLARKRLRNLVRHTPLERSDELSSRTGSEVSLKLENLQLTGSFKVRGALNYILSMSAEDRERGIVAPTAGNHGLGLAYAGAQLGVPTNIYLPGDADPGKIAAIQAFGATLHISDDIEAARLGALRYAKETGASFVSAYNEIAMIAAGGTVGLEILDDFPDVETILVCTGGGGLISGIAIAVKSIVPHVEVWGVQTQNSPTIANWVDAGKVIPVDLQTSIAEGLAGYIEPETITFPIIRDHVDRIITISEQNITDAMFWMLDHHRHVVEPSGVAAVAGTLKFAETDLKGRKLAIVVTGRNISRSRLAEILSLDGARA